MHIKFFLSVIIKHKVSKKSDNNIKAHTRTHLATTCINAHVINTFVIALFEDRDTNCGKQT